MKAEIKIDSKEGAEKGSGFMLPIWIITLLTMLGTSFACYAYHGYALNKLHGENLIQIKAAESRIEKHEIYRDIIKRDGKVAATEYLNKQ